MYGPATDLPVEAGDYAGIEATKTTVFYFTIPLRGMADRPGFFQEAGPIASLVAFDMNNRIVGDSWCLISGSMSDPAGISSSRPAAG